MFNLSKEELDQLENAMNQMLDYMINSGSKGAQIIRNREIIDKLTQMVVEKYYFPNDKDEEIEERICNLFIEIKTKLEDFISEMEV